MQASMTMKVEKIAFSTTAHAHGGALHSIALEIMMSSFHLSRVKKQRGVVGWCYPLFHSLSRVTMRK